MFLKDKIHTNTLRLYLEWLECLDSSGVVLGKYRVDEPAFDILSLLIQLSFSIASCIWTMDSEFNDFLYFSLV